MNQTTNLSTLKINKFSSEEQYKQALEDELIGEFELNLTPDLSAGQKVEAGGEIFNDYTNNQAKGQYSHAEGYETCAGTKGYYISHIIPATSTSIGKIYLTEDAAKAPTWGGEPTSTISISAPAWDLETETHYFSVQANSYYQWPRAAKITGFDEATGCLEYRKVITEGQEYWEGTSDRDKKPFFLFVDTWPTWGAISKGEDAHAEGRETLAAADQSHAEGEGTKAIGRYGHSEGVATVAGYAAHAEGLCSVALGLHSHSEGYTNESLGKDSHSEGRFTKAYGDFGSHAEGYGTTASGDFGSHAEGNGTKATINGAHAEGYKTEASGRYSHAEGGESKAVGVYSHSEGYGTTASSNQAHAEGNYTVASGIHSHAEGGRIAETGSTTLGDHRHTLTQGTTVTVQGSKAQGRGSHAENIQTLAYGYASHAEGYRTLAEGNYSHAEGLGTIANGTAQHVSGKYNKKNNEAIFIIGDGTEDSPHNALEIIPRNTSDDTNASVLVMSHTYSNYDNEASATWDSGTRKISIQPGYINLSLNETSIGQDSGEEYKSNDNLILSSSYIQYNGKYYSWADVIDGITQQQADQKYVAQTSPGGVTISCADEENGTGFFTIEDGYLQLISNNYNNEGVLIEVSGDADNRDLCFWGTEGDQPVRLYNVASPINAEDAANKQYVDNKPSVQIIRVEEDDA